MFHDCPPPQRSDRQSGTHFFSAQLVKHRDDCRALHEPRTSAVYVAFLPSVRCLASFLACVAMPCLLPSRPYFAVLSLSCFLFSAVHASLPLGSCGGQLFGEHRHREHLSHGPARPWRRERERERERGLEQGVRKTGPPRPHRARTKTRIGAVCAFRCDGAGCRVSPGFKLSKAGSGDPPLDLGLIVRPTLHGSLTELTPNMCQALSHRRFDRAQPCWLKEGKLSENKFPTSAHLCCVGSIRPRPLSSSSP